jgi:hypothetical protein
MHDFNESSLQAEFHRIHLSQEDSLRRLSDCEVQIAVNATRIRVLEDRIVQMVSLAEFMPVKWTFYGAIGTTLAAILTALIASVLAGAPHTGIR